MTEDKQPPLVRAFEVAKELEAWSPRTNKQRIATGAYAVVFFAAAFALNAPLVGLAAIFATGPLEKRMPYWRMRRLFATTTTDLSAVARVAPGTMVCVRGRMRARKQLCTASGVSAIGHRAEFYNERTLMGYVAMHGFDLVDEQGSEIPVEVGPSTLLRTQKKLEPRLIQQDERWTWARARGATELYGPQIAEALFLDGCPARVLGVIAHRPDPDGAALGREAAQVRVLSAATDAALRILV